MMLVHTWLYGLGLRRSECGPGTGSTAREIIKKEMVVHSAPQLVNQKLPFNRNPRGLFCTRQLETYKPVAQPRRSMLVLAVELPNIRTLSFGNQTLNLLWGGPSSRH